MARPMHFIRILQKLSYSSICTLHSALCTLNSAPGTPRTNQVLEYPDTRTAGFLKNDGHLGQQRKFNNPMKNYQENLNNSTEIYGTFWKYYEQ